MLKVSAKHQRCSAGCSVSMTTSLDELIESIRPERTHLENEKRAAEAFNSFPIQDARASDWSSFRDCTTRFYRHVSSAILGVRGTLPPFEDLEFGRVCGILMKEFGPDGEKAAANMAIHGVEGGLTQVLKVIARRLVEEYSENEVRARISARWNALTVDQKMAWSTEYLEKYEHLLPRDLTEGGAARLRALLPRYLEKHPEAAKRLRSIGR